MKSDLEETLAFHLQTFGLPKPQREYRFAAIVSGGTGKGLRRRLAAAELKDWRFDFAWPSKRLAVEVEGGTYVGGRHSRGAGMAADMEKYNAAALMGWTVLRFDSKAVKSARAADTILKALKERT